MPSVVKPSVVVADPDLVYQRTITGMLEPHFRCFATSTLDETHRTIWRVKPALVTLELAFPDGDGLQFIELLQADSTLRRILIACVTTRSTITDKVLAFRAGADDYFVKPLLPAMNFSGRMLLLRQSGHFARFAR